MATYRNNAQLLEGDMALYCYIGFVRVYIYIPG